MHRVLVINPGSTSTKVAVFEADSPDAPNEVLSVSVEHAKQQQTALGSVAKELPMRRQAVVRALEDAGFGGAPFSAVVGRGGMLRPVPSGTYAVNRNMLDDALDMGEREHAGNLGAILAYDIAQAQHVPAYVVDPISVDEFDPLARVAGLPGIERRSLSHALNLKPDCQGDRPHGYCARGRPAGHRPHGCPGPFRVARRLRRPVEWIAPVLVIAGQQEMRAMALGALRVLLWGEEPARAYGQEAGCG